MLSSAPLPPPHPHTVLMPFSSLLLGQDGELYSGTSYNFLGSEPIISRNSSHSPLRTEYAIPWLNGKKWRGPPRRVSTRAAASPGLPHALYF